MNLPMDVATSLQASPMGNAPAAKDNSDSGIMAGLAEQFSSLLGQALNQQAPVHAEPKEAKATSDPTLATLEKAVVDELPESAATNTPVANLTETTQPAGFAQNVFATLQALLNLKPASQPEPPATAVPQAATATPNTDAPAENNQPLPGNAPQNASLRLLLAQKALKPEETIQPPENVKPNEMADTTLMAALPTEAETAPTTVQTEPMNETPAPSHPEKEAAQPAEITMPDTNALPVNTPVDASAFAIAAQMAPAPALNNPTPAPAVEPAKTPAELPAIQASTPSVQASNTPLPSTPASTPTTNAAKPFSDQLATATQSNQPVVPASNTVAETPVSDNQGTYPSLSNDVGPSNTPTETASTDAAIPLNIASAMPEVKAEKKTSAELPKAPVSANSAAESTQATIPNSVSVNVMQDLSDKLASLNGSIEAASAPENTQDATIPDAFADSLTQAAPQDAATELAPNGLAHPVSQDNASGVQTHSDHSNLPQFMSKAIDPTDQVAEGTVYSVKNGHKELVIRLNPDNLGEVRVSLTASSNSSNAISARLIASSQESHAMLQDQIQSLKTSLEAQGIQIERLSVVVAGSPSSEMGNSHSGHQSSQQHQSFQQGQHASNAATQQDFNQQQQGQPQWASQTGNPHFQQKSGFAQNPGSSRYVGSSSGNNETENPRPQAARNDDGRISILA